MHQQIPLTSNVMDMEPALERALVLQRSSEARGQQTFDQKLT
jgi:hypothetical protein